MPAIWLKTAPTARQSLALLSWDGAAAWHALRLHSASTGSDGRVRKLELLPAFDRKITEPRALKLIDELVAHGHLRDRGDHWEITDWLVDQPEADVFADPVKLGRWKRDKRLKRNEPLCDQIKARDQHRCRYCGTRVNWASRTGHIAGQYDHVNPDGDNDIENVVVACRRCNQRKADRTLQQAAMALWPPGTTAEEISAGTARPASGLSRGQARAEPGAQPRSGSAASYGPGRAGPSRGSARAQPDESPTNRSASPPHGSEP